MRPTDQVGLATPGLDGHIDEFEAEIVRDGMDPTIPQKNDGCPQDQFYR